MKLEFSADPLYLRARDRHSVALPLKRVNGRDRMAFGMLAPRVHA